MKQKYYSTFVQILMRFSTGSILKLLHIKVHANNDTRMLYIFLGFLSIIMVLIGSLSSYTENKYVNNESIHTIATIIDTGEIRRTHSYRGPNIHQVRAPKVQFLDNYQKHELVTKELKISVEKIPLLQLGKKIGIAYSPDKDTAYDLTDFNETTRTIHYLFFLYPVLLLVLIIFRNIRLKRRRQHEEDSIAVQKNNQKLSETLPKA